MEQRGKPYALIPVSLFTCELAGKPYYGCRALWGAWHLVKGRLMWSRVGILAAGRGQLSCSILQETRGTAVLCCGSDFLALAGRTGSTTALWFGWPCLPPVCVTCGIQPVCAAPGRDAICTDHGSIPPCIRKRHVAGLVCWSCRVDWHQTLNIPGSRRLWLILS